MYIAISQPLPEQGGGETFWEGSVKEASTRPGVAFPLQVIGYTHSMGCSC